MSELYAVNCPHCGASGQLSDPALKGTAIYCPACSKPFVVPAAVTATPVSPVAVPVAVAATPAPTAAPVAVPVAQPVPVSVPVSIPLAVPVATPIAQPVVPGSLPIATASPAFPVAAAVTTIPGNQPTASAAAPIDFPNVAAFQTDALTPALTSEKPAVHRPRKPPSAQMGLLKVALLSIFSAVSLFGIVVLSQKTPRRSPTPVIASTTKKPKKSSRRKTAAATPRPAAVTPETMPESEEIKPAEPQLELAASTPAAPRMEKPAAPQPAAARPPETAQTIENIPAEVKRELEYAEDKKDLPALIKLLAHPHAGVRQRVAERLAWMEPTPDLALPLAKQLTDPNPVVRRATIKALAIHGTTVPESIPALGKTLRQDGDAETRSAAADALAELAAGSPERATAAAGPLLEAFEKGPAEDLYSVVIAVGALGESGQPAIPSLNSLVKDPRLGEVAVTTLARLGHFETFPPILAGTDSSHFLKKCGIAEGLGKLRPMTPAALAIIKTLTEDKDETIRVRAIDALLKAEPKLPEAIPLFERALTDSDKFVRDSAAKGLGMYASGDPIRNMRSLLAQMIKTEESVWMYSQIADAMQSTKAEGFAALLQILADPQSTPEIRNAAGQVVAMSYYTGWYDAKHIDALKKLFDEPGQSLTIRAGCAIALLTLMDTDPRLVTTLIEALRDKSVDFQVREVAATNVPREREELLPSLLAAAEECEAAPATELSKFETRKRVHFYAAVLNAMQHLNPELRKQVLPRLVAAIKHEDGMIQMQALDTVGKFEDATPEVVEAIRPVLKHERREVRDKAFDAIGRLHQVAAAALPDLGAALKSEDSNVRSSAVHALGEFGPAANSFVPDLIALLADEKQITGYVPEALARIAPQDPAAVAAVVKALDRPDLRDSVLGALRDIGPAAGAAVPTLCKLLPDADNTLRWRLLWTLGKMGAAATSAVPDIVQQLTDRDDEVREAAASALENLNQHAAAAVPELIKTLNDPVEDVQFRIVGALQAIGPAAKAAIPDLEKLVAATKSDSLKQATTNAITRLQADPGDADPALFATLLDSSDWSELPKTLAKQPDLGFPALARLMLNKNSDVRGRASFLVGELSRPPASRAVLEKLLESAEPRERALAALTLRQLPPAADKAEFAQSLIPWTASEYSSWNAAELMVQCGSPSVPVIATVLTDDKQPAVVRRHILNAVRQSTDFDTAGLTASLQVAMKSDNPDQRRVAALAVSSLNPRDSAALPLIIECLTSQDQEIQRDALQAIQIAAEAEMDVTAAVPGLIDFLGHCQAELATRDVENQYLHGTVCQTLRLIGVRTEDVPRLRQILTETFQTTRTGDDDIQTRKREMSATLIAGLIGVLGSVQPPAVDALTDIKSVLVAGYSPIDDENLSQISVGLSGLGEPAFEMLHDISRQAELPPVARGLAVRLIGECGIAGARTTAALQEALQDPDIAVRTAAAIALARDAATFAAALPVLREALRTVPPKDQLDQRNQIISRLIELKEQSTVAVPELLELIKQTDNAEWLRLFAAQGAIEIAPMAPEVQTAIGECVKGFTEAYALNLLSATGELPLGDIVAGLIATVEDGTSPRRVIAVRQLGTLQEKALAAIPALRMVMTTDQGEAGRAAAIAIARIDPAAKDVLSAVLDQFLKDQQRRYEAHLALRRLGPNAAEALPQLLEAIQNPDLAEATIQVIGSLGAAARPALPAIVAAATAREPRYSAWTTLKELGPVAADAGPELLQRLRSGETSRQLIRALAAIGGEPAREAAEELRKVAQDETRCLAALDLLATFGAAAATTVPDLIKFAETGDLQRRLAALKTLSAIGPDAKAATPLLASALTDPDPRIAENAALALQSLKGEVLPVLPQIIAALQKPRRRTQNILVDILKELGPAAKDSVPVLTQLQSSPDPGLRRGADSALREIQSMPETKSPE